MQIPVGHHRKRGRDMGSACDELAVKLRALVIDLRTGGIEQPPHRARIAAAPREQMRHDRIERQQLRQGREELSRAAVERMKAGSVIVDIPAESGGNCELTRAGETVVHNGVKIVGPVNLPAQLAYHASEMYARNLLNLIKPALDKSGALAIDWNDEVFAQSCLTHDGAIKHEATRKAVEGT